MTVNDLKERIDSLIAKGHGGHRLLVCDSRNGQYDEEIGLSEHRNDGDDDDLLEEFGVPVGEDFICVVVG